MLTEHGNYSPKHLNATRLGENFRTPESFGLQLPASPARTIDEKKWLRELWSKPTTSELCCFRCSDVLTQGKSASCVRWWPIWTARERSEVKLNECWSSCPLRQMPASEISLSEEKELGNEVLKLHSPSLSLFYYLLNEDKVTVEAPVLSAGCKILVLVGSGTRFIEADKSKKPGEKSLFDTWKEHFYSKTNLLHLRSKKVTRKSPSATFFSSAMDTR